QLHRRLLATRRRLGNKAQPQLPPAPAASPLRRRHQSLAREPAVCDFDPAGHVRLNEIARKCYSYHRSPGRETILRAFTGATVLLLITLSMPAVASARTLTVGLNSQLRSPSAAAAMVKNGDTVLIEPGEYSDCAVW